MYHDNYGLEVSCASQAALDAYMIGLQAALTLDHSGIPELEKAIELDPQFVLAYGLLARQCVIHGQAERIGPSLELAEKYVGSASSWEQSSLAVTIAMLRHEPKTLDLALDHAKAYPRDVTVLMHIIGPFGLSAFSGRRDWREQNVGLVEQVQARFSDDDWWMQATLGFSYAEIGDATKAVSCSERSWQLSENGNSGHAMAHAQFEQAAVDGGIAFLDEWLGKLAGTSDMRHHMLWHRALLLLEMGQTDVLLDLFQADLAPRDDSTPPLDLLSDNASLLWRLALRGVEIPEALWTQTFDIAESKFSSLGFAFADLHRVLATASQGSEERLRLQESLAQEDAPFLEACAKAFNAFADKDYPLAAETLRNSVDDALFVGGSNPQRRVVRETYEEALRRSRQNA